MVLKKSRDRAVSGGSLIWALAMFLCDILSFPHVIRPCSHIGFVLILSSFMATLWPQLLNLIPSQQLFPEQERTSVRATVLHHSREHSSHDIQCGSWSGSKCPRIPSKTRLSLCLIQCWPQEPIAMSRNRTSCWVYSRAMEATSVEKQRLIGIKLKMIFKG